ncbi:MAG: elongation factor G [Kiritimatiellae bacterium]|nr:elongation factor G [Kiritimatiellia bacterium]
MKDAAIGDVRNFVLMGHTGSGKTTLADALLVKLGVTATAGSVDAGTSLSDYTDEEKEKKISIYATPFSGVWQASGGQKVPVFFSDTPGYDEFFGQVVGASRAADSALIVIDASSGIQVGASRAWKQVRTLGLSAGIVITGLDRENVDFAGRVEEIRKLWGDKCVPVVLPLPDASGVVDVLGAKDVPGALSARVEDLKGSLIEMAAESDDALIEKYLGGEELSAAEIATGLRGAVRDGRLVPIFAAVPPKDVGLAELLNGVARLLPSPADVAIKDAEGNVVDSSPDAPFVGLVWRTVTDPFAGRLAILRVYGGTLKEGMDLLNPGNGQKERAGPVLVMNGKKQSPVPQGSAGDIVALAKLKDTSLGDVLCAPAHKVAFAPIGFPSPVVAYAVGAQKREDMDKIGTALARIAEDDPSIIFERNAETRQLILSGMGDIHLGVALGLMKKRSNVEVALTTPRVAYKETVTGKGEGHYKHKKQSGGRGQYAEVYARVEPKQPDEEEWFHDEIFGGAIPRNFVPAVEKGFVEAMVSGAVAGYPVVNTKAIVYDGSFHEVDSSEIAFKIAASRAFREAMANAKPVLLEPIMTVRIAVPDPYMGDVNGDLSQKRGRILGMGVEDGVQVITAEVPRAELFRYASELRSMTGGRGTFEMEFSRYEIVPGQVAQKVVAEMEKAKEQDE